MIERSKAAGTEYLRRSGTGIPLVLLHGIGSNAESWLPMIADLDPDIDVIAWNAPGYGASDPIATPRPAAYADRLQSLLDALGLARIVLAGHSLGCLFAAAYVASYPVAGLAFLSPALGYGVPAGAPLPANVQSRIDDLNKLGPREFAAKRAARLVYHPEAKPTVLAGVQRGMAAVRPDGYADAVRALGGGTLLADAAKITIPALVAIGEQDVVTPPNNARALHAALPSPGTLHFIADSGHALPQEQPAEVARLLEGLTRHA